MIQDNCGPPLVDTYSHIFSFLLMKPMGYDFMGLKILIIQGYLSYMCEFSSMMMPMVKSEKDGQISFNLDTFDLSWEEAYILV